MEIRNCLNKWEPISLSAQHCSQMCLPVSLPSPTSFPTPPITQKQTLFPAFLGAPTILTACFMAFPLSPDVLRNAPITPHRPLSPFLPFPSFCFHLCCLITIHVLFSPYLSFSLSHHLVTILIVSIAISQFSLCPWLFLSLIIILIILSPILPSWQFIVLVKTKLGELQTTMSHSNWGLRHVACFMDIHQMCATRGETFLVTLVKNDEITKLDWVHVGPCTCYKDLDPKFPWPNKKGFVTW